METAEERAKRPEAGREANQGGSPGADPRAESLKRDIAAARKLKEIVIGELRNGVNPKWIAVKYGHLGVTLERVLAAKVAIDQQEEQRGGKKVAR